MFCGIVAARQLTSRLSGSFAIAGDQNPGIAGRNSRNHESRGQNILFADNHVEWTSSTHVGLNGDDVYTNKKGVVVGSPVDAGDSVLLPIDN